TRRPLEEAGSGVLVEINERLYVLTNRHVIKDANLTSIRIELSDGRSINPSQVWSDRGTDIAVMSVPSENLIPARVGNSDKLEIGDFVMAVGSPFGLSHSVTFGIISAKGRRDLKLGDDEVRFQDFMQTDAAINPGNSGGPLLNLKGEVVGLNTAIASNSGGNEGIGFTIPINMVMVVAKQLIDRGVVVRAFLGVHLDSKFNAATANDLGLPRLMGAKVSAITPSSPAETAKLKIGDVILTYNSVRVEDDNHLVNLVSLTPVGRDVAVILWRSGRQQTIQVRVGTRSEFNK
ncbi:MAG: serine protease Do, partial [Pirellulaceae bacterium]